MGPRPAIREGVLSSLALLRDHLRDLYDGLQYDHHVYDGGAPGRIRQLATASHLQIMVINIAAMTGDANTRLIHRRTDALNGYAPIEFLRACRPIVVMDEPQSLDGPTQVPATAARGRSRPCRSVRDASARVLATGRSRVLRRRTRR